MSRIDRHRGTLEARILLWGPSASGKSETLRALHRAIDPEGRSTLFRLAEEDGSTAYFDLLPLEEFRFGGQRVRLACCAAPGGLDRGPERRSLLRSADAVLFVADASRAALGDNRAAVRELEETLEAMGRRRDEVPIVWSFNKQDADDLIVSRELREMIVPGSDPVYESVASEERGVWEAFRETFRQLLQSLARRHGLESEPEDRDGLPEQLLPSIVRRQRTRGEPRRPENDPIVDLYVPATDIPDAERSVETMMAMALSHVELADSQRKTDARNTELNSINRVARSILSAMEIDNLLVVLLDATVDRVGTSHAGVVVFDPANDGALRTHVTGFGRDPALGLGSDAARRFFQLMRESDGPIPADEIRDPELLEALRAVDKRIESAIIQPIKVNGTAPGGWISLYPMEGENRIDAQVLLFLSSISRLAALGLDKIAQLDRMTRSHGESDAAQQELASRLEMAQARVRALNRGMESKVTERTRALENEMEQLRTNVARSANQARVNGMSSLASSFSREIHKPVVELARLLAEARTELEIARESSAEPEVADRRAPLERLDELLAGCVQNAEIMEAVAASLDRLGGSIRGAADGWALNAAVADAVTLLEGRIEGCAELDLRLGKVPPIPGDESQLGQVVLALVTNALEAIERSGRRGKITVTTFLDGESVVLRVADDGPGIDADILPRVCEPFVTTKQEVSGAGLGLHAAQATLDAQGGSLRIRSKVGDGTSATATFVVPSTSSVTG